MYKCGYALEKLQFTNFDLQICNCKVAMLACSGYKVPTLHLQNTKLHFSNFGLQVWNDITQMYIYGTTNHKYWFTNLQLHGCNVRILTPLAFHICAHQNFWYGKSHIDVQCMYMITVKQIYVQSTANLSMTLRWPVSVCQTYFGLIMWLVNLQKFINSIISFY